MSKPVNLFLCLVLLFLFLAAASRTIAQTETDPQSGAQTEKSTPAADQSQSAPAQSAPAEAKPAAQPKADQKEAKQATDQEKEESHQLRLPPLPSPVTGNAVATLHTRGATLLFSLMGMGAKKSWDSVTNAAFYLDPDWDQWYPIKPVPGTAGRLDASAIGARGNVFLFGGVVVDNQNRGVVISDVNIYAPSAETWSRGRDMPTPVAYSVVGVYRDRYIYVFGGRSNNGVVSNVQIYDSEKNEWLQGTQFPGDPVFGHAGGLVDDTIVLVDGAAKNPAATGAPFVASDQCWLGKLDRKDPTRIAWSKIPAHPGTARFGIAAAAAERDHKIYFSGGTDNPDGETGIGFDGKPAEPSPMTFAWNVRGSKWEVVNPATPNPTLNNRGLLVIPDFLSVAGGVEKGQNVTRRVTLIPLTKAR